MADDEDGSNSPPLPKGSYNFNFDDLDSLDPFKSSKGLRNSPDKELDVNPFVSKSNLSSSPPINNHISEEVNPFQTKTKLGQSPPNDSGFQDNLNTCTVIPDNESVTHDSSAESVKTAFEESPVKCNTGTFVKKKKKSPKSSPQPDNDPGNEGVGEKELDTGTFVKKKKKSPKNSPQQDNDLGDEGDKVLDGGADVEPNIPEKKPSPKKSSGLKKPKARTKFKPPTNFGVKDSDDVIIYTPTQTAENSSDTCNTEPVPNEIEDFPPPPTDIEINPGDISDLNNGLVDDIENMSMLDDTEICNDGGGDLPSQLSDLKDVTGEGQMMMDSVHDFGAGEMPMENNEEFVPAHEAFNEDDDAWQIMEKMNNEENAPAGRESLSAFDPLTENEVPDKVTRRSSEINLGSNSEIGDEDLILMNTPPSNKSSGNTRAGSRHPAARALQEQVEGDGAPKEAHVIDTMLFSPGKGTEIKRTSEEQDRYFDALEYPYSSRRAQQGDNEVSRMNAVNKKQGDGGQDSVVQLVQVLKYSQSDWNKMRQDLELEFNAKILNKEREWSKKLADRDKKIATMEDQTLQLRSANDDMKLVVAEFDKTISQLQADKEKTTSETMTSLDDVLKEREQALEDLQSVETAFSDLHQRYERTKGVVEGLKKNEDILKKCVQDYQVKLKNAEDKAVSVRQQAEEKLDLASMEMEKLRKSTIAEVARLEAALKKADLKIHGLDRSLEQKVKENDELTAICDELIAKVGGD